MKVNFKKSIETRVCPMCGNSELVFTGDYFDYEYYCDDCEEYFDEPELHIEYTGEVILEIKKDIDLDVGDYVLYKNKICAVDSVEPGNIKLIYRLYDFMCNITKEEKFEVSNIKDIKILPF